MKKILSLTLVILLILSALPVLTVSAEYDPSDDIITDEYNYEILEDGTAAINRYLGTADEVEVPSEIEGYKVTVIHRYAFADNKTIKSVILPEGITRIGFCAFDRCTNLETLVLPDSLQGLHKMYIERTKVYQNPDNWVDGVLYISNHLIDTKENAVKGICTVREGTVSISNFAFEGNNTLTEVILPDSVHTIADSAFRDCKKLEKINLHDNLTNIEFGAFSGCESLAEVHIPKNIKEIGPYAFRGCGISELNLPEGLEKINYDAFAGCVNLKSVTVPQSVTYLGDSAFARCESLEEINLPDSFEYLGDSIVYGTAYADNPDNWENGLLYSGNYLLDSDSDIAGSVYVKDGTTYVATRTFCYRSKLVHVSLPDSVEYIGDQCFGGSENLRQVRMPKTLKTLGDYAFQHCPALKRISVPEGVTEIPQDAFLCCDKLNYISIPASVTTIAEQAVGYDNPYYDTDLIVERDQYVKNENLIIAGHKGTAAEQYAIDNGFKFKDLDAPTEYKYKDKVLELLELSETETNDGSPCLSYYSEGYEYYSNEEGSEATPDYVLISVASNLYTESSFSYRFGDYVMYETSSPYPFALGYGIYFPKTNEICSLVSAWEKGVEGIENVFTIGNLGNLAGDVNYDEKLNIKDATLIQKHLAGLENLYNYTISDGLGELIPDYNDDGKLNIRDATAIQKRLVKIDPDYNPQPPTLPEKAEGEAEIIFIGVPYKVNVGDIITISADLYSKELISQLSVDIKSSESSMLKPLQYESMSKSEFIAQHCPNLENVELRYPGYGNSSGSYINVMVKNANMNFTVEQSLCYFSFKVTKPGKTYLSMNLQSVYNTNDERLMVNTVATVGSDISCDRVLTITKG